MSCQSTELSRRGDQVFDALALEFPQARRFRLMLEQRLRPARFEGIRSALLGYIASVTAAPGPLSEQEACERLLEERRNLSNYTRGGMLAPKREHTLELNLLHRSLVSALADFDIAKHIEGIDLPVNVRLVYGDVDPDRSGAPYSSSKLHTDVWAGVPPDAAVCVLPVLGDIEHISIECFEMAREQELEALRALRDYDEGKHIVPSVAYSDGKLQHGHLYVADARLLHRTVRHRASGVRVSLDFRFRYNDAEYRKLTPAIECGGPDSSNTRVPFHVWQDVGRETLLVPDASLSDRQAPNVEASSSPVASTGYSLIQLSAESAVSV